MAIYPTMRMQWLLNMQSRCHKLFGLLLWTGVSAKTFDLVNYSKEHLARGHCVHLLAGSKCLPSEVLIRLVDTQSKNVLSFCLIMYLLSYCLYSSHRKTLFQFFFDLTWFPYTQLVQHLNTTHKTIPVKLEELILRPMCLYCVYTRSAVFQLEIYRGGGRRAKSSPFKAHWFLDLWRRPLSPAL